MSKQAVSHEGKVVIVDTDTGEVTHPPGNAIEGTITSIATGIAGSVVDALTLGLLSDRGSDKK